MQCVGMVTRREKVTGPPAQPVAQSTQTPRDRQILARVRVRSLCLPETQPDHHARVETIVRDVRAHTDKGVVGYVSGIGRFTSYVFSRPNGTHLLTVGANVIERDAVSALVALLYR